MRNYAYVSDSVNCLVFVLEDLRICAPRLMIIFIHMCKASQTWYMSSKYNASHVMSFTNKKTCNKSAVHVRVGAVICMFHHQNTYGSQNKCFVHMYDTF